MQSVRTEPTPLRDLVKNGIVAGQAAAWAIFGVFLSVDATLVTPPGTFYKMIGMALGQGSSTDVYVGFLLHMITATIIGIIYTVISGSVKKLYISSVYKGIGTGAITGVAVWTVLFLPLHFGLMQPMLQNIVTTADPSSSVQQIATRLVQFSDTILVGSLGMHILFGCVLGFLGRLSTSMGEILEKKME